MLTDPQEIKIIAKAKQKNVRDHKRSRQHFLNIFADFLNDKDLQDKTLLDLGPGQYDFGEIAKQRGAIIHGIDKDIAVLELGEYKGFYVQKCDLKNLDVKQINTIYDGIFCKFSINAFWFWEDQQKHIAHIETITNILQSNGWSWIAPWNGVPKNAQLSNDEIEQILAIQIEEFKKKGFQCFNLTESLAKYYGVHGTTANRALFIKNLPIPRLLNKCECL